VQNAPPIIVKKCVDPLLNSSSKCLNCKNELMSIDAESYLTYDLTDLLLTCQFKLSGCEEKIKYDSIIDHERKCKFKDQICGKCVQKFYYKDYLSHIVTCDKENYKIIEQRMKLLEERSCSEFLVLKNDIHSYYNTLKINVDNFEKKILFYKKKTSTLCQINSQSLKT